MDSSILIDLFKLDVPILEKILRPIVVYLFLVVALRLAGKRELAQLNPFDLVVLLTLANTVQNAIIGNDNSVSGGLIGAATILVVNYLVVRFLYSHEDLERVIEGGSVVLIENGKMRDDRRRKELITKAELEEAAHKQGFASLDAIDRAVLEPGGALSFVAKQPAQDEVRYREVLTRLEAISRDIGRLQQRQ